MHVHTASWVLLAALAAVLSGACDNDGDGLPLELSDGDAAGGPLGSRTNVRPGQQSDVDAAATPLGGGADGPLGPKSVGVSTSDASGPDLAQQKPDAAEPDATVSLDMAPPPQPDTANPASPPDTASPPLTGPCAGKATGASCAADLCDDSTLVRFACNAQGTCARSETACKNHGACVSGKCD